MPFHAALACDVKALIGRNRGRRSKPRTLSVLILVSALSLEQKSASRGTADTCRRLSWIHWDSKGSWDKDVEIVFWRTSPSKPLR